MLNRKPDMATPRVTLSVLLVALFCASTLGAPAAEREPPRVLVLLGAGFLPSEFYEPYFGLRAAGYEVDVASNAGETVPSGIPFDGAMGLDAVNVERYAAVFTPGGGSPKNLEKAPESMRIIRRFDEADKLVAGLCHGSRLLMKSDILSGHTFTGVWLIKDELPAMWTSATGVGAYLDEPTVSDGNLLTSRCPWDAAVFTRRFIETLAERGGPGLPDRRGRLLVVAPKQRTKARFAFTTSMRALGVEVEVLAGLIDADDAEAIVVERDHALVVLPGASGKDQIDAASIEGLQGRFAAAERPVHVLDEQAVGNEAKIVAAMRAVLESLPQGSDEEAADVNPMEAVLAITPGFDGRTAAAMHAWLHRRFDRVATMAPETGWVRGMNGTPLRAGHRYADPPKLAEGALIVMPGGFWPHSKGQRAEKQRVRWVVDQHADVNAHVVAIGLDSYELVRLGGEAFKGAAVTGTDQVDWAMRGKPVTFKLGEAVVHAPEHRLTTARGFESVPALWRILEGPQDPQETR